MDYGWSRFFIFLNGQENETKESARVTGCSLALLTIGGVCGTRCAQTATDPTSADGCDARPVTKGLKLGIGTLWWDTGVSGLNIQQNENRLCRTHGSTVTAKNRRA
jgi:hypothetical protein